MASITSKKQLAENDETSDREICNGNLRQTQFSFQKPPRDYAEIFVAVCRKCCTQNPQTELIPLLIIHSFSIKFYFRHRLTNHYEFLSYGFETLNLFQLY